jgi:hypothetical protein
MWERLRQVLWPKDQQVDLPTAVSYEEPASSAAASKGVKRTSTFTRYRPGYPDHPFAVWVRSIGVFTLGLVAGFLSYRDYVAKRAEAGQSVHIQVESLTWNRQMDRFRAAASLVPHIRCEQDEQTQLALELLKTTVPEEAKVFAQLLQSECAQLKPATVRELKSLQHESARGELKTQFMDALAVAWLYREYGSNDAALQWFEGASNRIPQAYANQVNFDEVRRARESSTNGSIKEAVDHYANAFRAIGTQ